MPQGWTPTRIGNICKTNQRTYSVAEKWPFVNYLETGNITENRVGEIQHIVIGQDTLPSRARRKVEVDDIIYSTVRPNQRHYGIVRDVLPNMLVSTGFTVITGDKEKVDSDFLYYYLTQSDIVDSLHAIGEQSVSAYPSIKPSDIESVELDLPPLPDQVEIGHTLRVLDDKIANNTKINNHLEQMAQAIFKSWFVDFEPFGGEQPANWAIGTISDISADIVCGKTPSTKVAEYFGEDIPFITIPDMHSIVYVTSTERSLSTAGAESQRGKTVPPNSICVSCIATAGLVALTSVPSQTNQQINTIVCKDGISPYFVYLTMVGMAEHIKMLGSSGSATSNLNKGQFSKIELVIPENSDIKEFAALVEPLFKAIKANQQENALLAGTRDALLPRLMSGELSVADVNTK